MSHTDRPPPEQNSPPTQGQGHGETNPGAPDPDWNARTGLLLCIGPWPDADHVVHRAASLAKRLDVEWHAIYVETEKLQRLPAKRRERILVTLKSAQTLGATTAVLAGKDIAREIVDYARHHRFSTIVLGRDRSRWPWQTSHLKRIAAWAPELDLIDVGAPEAQAQPDSGPADGIDATLADVDAGLPGRSKRFRDYLWTVASCALTTLLATPMAQYFTLTNIAMLFLLNVLLVAVRFGRGPSVFAAFLNVAAFDFFFVPPRFTFAISDLQYLLVFGVMLVVGLITAQLTASLRFQAKIASRREARARALYEFARALSGTLQTEQIFATTQKFVQLTFRAKASVLLPDALQRLQMPPAVSDDRTEALHLNVLDLGLAQWAFDHAAPAGMGTDTLPGSSIFFLPLVAPMRTRGVLAIKPESRRSILIPEQRQQLDTFATLAAIALERVHFVEIARDALVRIESERLRNSLLAAISHDLRTPLTSLRGLAESLARSRPLLPPQQVLAQALHDETLRMSNLVANLLDMARIQSGAVKLNLQWQPVEEVIGSALRASRMMLSEHEVQTRLESDLPLVQFDAVLIERVLCNLVENAAKYTPAGARIVVTARVAENVLEVAVHDNGPGLPPGQEEAIFEKFTRGARESATPGIGLGLAICRAIVDAHGGTIRAADAADSPEGGACIRFALPLGTPPALPEIDEGETHDISDPAA